LGTFQKFWQFARVIFYIAKSKNYKEHLSFAQAGEDKILRFLFSSMGYKNISYLEIGTNNPIDINNTYLFYLGGSRGVCVEPNPMLISKIKKYRPEDICLNIGVGISNGDDLLDFYIFDESDPEKGLSTFSKQEAEFVQNTTHIKIAEVKRIPVTTINKILEENFGNKSPDFVSVDVEGLDLEILQSIDFMKYRPIAICVETVNFTINHKKIKNKNIIQFMETQGYFVYADTGINTIFADKNLF
jgi:FkbM family methyltransferase